MISFLRLLLQTTLCIMVLLLLTPSGLTVHAQTSPPAGSNAEVGTGDPVQALNAVVNEAGSAGVTPQLAQRFHNTFMQLMTTAEEQLATTPDQARASYQALYNALGSQTGRQLFAQTPAAASYQQVANQIMANFAEANYQLARRLANDASQRQTVQELYAKAVYLTGQRNFTYLNALGDTARVNSDMDTAFSAFRAVVQNPAANQQQVSVAREGLDRIAIATGNRLVLPDVTPTPQATAVTLTPRPVSLPPNEAIAETPQQQVVPPTQDAGTPSSESPADRLNF